MVKALITEGTVVNGRDARPGAVVEVSESDFLLLKCNGKAVAFTPSAESVSAAEPGAAPPVGERTNREQDVGKRMRKRSNLVQSTLI